MLGPEHDCKLLLFCLLTVEVVVMSDLIWEPCVHHSFRDGLYYSNRTVNETGTLYVEVPPLGDYAWIEPGVRESVLVEGPKLFTIRSCHACLQEGL